MNIKRILTFVLALLMSISALVSCEPANPGQTTETPVTVHVTDTSESTGTQAATEPSMSSDAPYTTSSPGETSDETDPSGVTTEKHDTTSNPDTTEAPKPDTTDGRGNDTTPVETEPEGQKPDPANIMFRQVYGTGANNDTPVRYSFIELYNVSTVDIPLSNLSLHYLNPDTKKYVTFKFADETVIGAAKSYLIRCGAAVDEKGNVYNTSYEKIRIDYYDASWNIVLDNKEVTLALTMRSTSLTPTVKLPGNKSVYAYFIGTQSVTSDINAAVGISKNKAAYKTSATAKYEIIEYKTATATKIADSRPMYSGGDRNTWLSATANVVSFSKEAGFYDAGFRLELSALSGYTIYYTTNGKDPRASGTKYSGSLNISDTSKVSWGYLTRLCNKLNGSAMPVVTTQLGAKVVKAYATNGKTSTQVVTRTYFVIPGASKYNVPFLSLSIEPDEFLSPDRGIYYTVMKHPFEQKERRTAYCEIMETNGTCVSSSYVEIAMNGNGSLGFGAKSMRVYFKADADPTVVGNPSKLKYDIFQGKAENGVTEYKRLLLRNSGNDSSQSHLRDAYMQLLCAPLECPIMAYRPSLLFINGEFWGVYNIRERYDAKYFEEHYGISEENFCMLESISPLITGSWNTPYALNDGVEGDEVPFHELVSYIEKNNMANDDNFKYVSDRIDMDNLVDFLVGSMFLCNTDWPGNNIKVWRNKNPKDPSGMDTKWRFGFCDMDMGVGLATNIDTNMFVHAINENTVLGRIVNRLCNNASFKQKLISRFYECADTIFDTSVTLPVLDQMNAAVKDIMKLHFIRWPSDGGSAGNYDNCINNIRYFMTNRKERALAHMEAFFGIQPSQIGVSMDMNGAELRINGIQIPESGYAEVFSDSVKLNFKVTVKSGYDFLGIKTVSDSGTSKTYQTSNITVTIDEAVTVIVMTKKTGFTTKPAVVTGSRSIFVLDKEGNLYAWGENNLAQNCVKTSDTMTKPILVMTGVAKIATSMGGTEGDAPVTAILTSSGEVYTVGNNSVGQLGRSGNEYVLAKAKINVKIKDIACGLDHLIVLAENGDMYGVGNNAYGQLGEVGFTGAVYEFTKIATDVRSIAAGRRHTIFIKTDGKLYALGDNRWSKFSTTAPEQLTEPLLLGENFEFISTGQHNCLAIDTTGDLYYFGWRSPTDFGAGNSAGGLTVIATGIKEAYVQDEHIIMLATDGKVYGTGFNNNGQICNDMQNKTTPYLITDNCIAAGAGTYYSAVIKNDGSVLVWGSNKSGVIGNGSVNAGYTSPHTAMKITP